MLYSWIYVCLFGLIVGTRGDDWKDDDVFLFNDFANTTETPEAQYGGIIYKGNTPVCIGAIVALAVAEKKKVIMVTAASCVQRASNLEVSIGECRTKINYVKIHPFYKPPLYDYDIAVLIVECQSIEGEVKEMLPLPLPDKPENENSKNLWVTEFKTPQNWEKVGATKEERQVCQSKHGSKIRISTKMICVQSTAKVLVGSALCYNEEGSSAPAENYFLLGVASYIPNSSLPIIFTNIANSQIKKFIDQYI